MSALNKQALKNITHPLLITSPDNRHIPNNTLSLYHTNICSLSAHHLVLVRPVAGLVEGVVDDEPPVVILGAAQLFGAEGAHIAEADVAQNKTATAAYK